MFTLFEGNMTFTITSGITSPITFNSIRFTTAAGQFEVGSAPEPSTLALFATGLALLGFIGWRRRRSVPVRAA